MNHLRFFLLMIPWAVALGLTSAAAKRFFGLDPKSVWSDLLGGGLVGGGVLGGMFFLIRQVNLGKFKWLEKK